MFKATFYTLSIVFILELIFFSLIRGADGDTGVYISFVYQVVQGALPYRDFWYQQGIGYMWFLCPIASVVGHSFFYHKIYFFVFSCLNALILVLIIKRYLEDQKIALSKNIFWYCSVTILGSFSFWFQMVSLGTKSSLVCLLIMSAFYAMQRFWSNHKIILLILAGFFYGALLSTKLNFLGVPLAVNLLLLCHQNRLKNLVIFNVAILCMIVIFHTPYLSFEGLTMIKENFKLTKDTYPETELSGLLLIRFHIYKILEIMNFHLMKYMPFAFAFYLTIIHFQISKLGALLKKDKLICLLVLQFIIYSCSNIIMLYPHFFLVHYQPPYIFLLLLSILWIIKITNQDEDVMKSFQSVAQFWIPFSVIFLWTNVSFLWTENITVLGGGLLDFKYHILGNNKPTKHLNTLKAEGYENYLFIGLSNHWVINSQLRESSFSVSGSSPMAVRAKNQILPDRETANRVPMIAASNMDDLLNKHTVIILEPKALEFTILDYKYLVQCINQKGFIRSFADDQLEIYKSVKNF